MRCVCRCLGMTGSLSKRPPATIRSCRPTPERARSLFRLGLLTLRSFYFLYCFLVLSFIRITSYKHFLYNFITTPSTSTTKSMLPTRQSLASTALILSSLFTATNAASLSDWQSRSIYQVKHGLQFGRRRNWLTSPFVQLVTDRFAKTVDDGGPCDSGARQYCGGTWKGISELSSYWAQGRHLTLDCSQPSGLHLWHGL